MTTLKNIPNLRIIALAGAVIVPLLAARADETNPWHLDTSLNLFAAGMSGDVAVKGQVAHVDPSFGDLFEHFKGGAAGRVTLSPTTRPAAARANSAMT